MKKVYAKPQIYVENFSLSQSVATTCGAGKHPGCGKPNLAEAGSCGWETGTTLGTIWTQSVGREKCANFRPEGVIGGFCYNNPNGAIALFSIS